MITVNIPTITSFAEAWPIWLTLLSLIGTAIANQPHWTATIKKWVTLAVTAGTSLLYAIATGQISEVPASTREILTHWLIVGATIFVIGQAIYPYLKGLLAVIETKTSPLTEVAPGPNEGTAGLNEGGDAAAESVAEDTSDTPPSELEA